MLSHKGWILYCASVKHIAEEFCCSLVYDCDKSFINVYTHISNIERGGMKSATNYINFISRIHLSKIGNYLPVNGSKWGEINLVVQQQTPEKVEPEHFIQRTLAIEHMIFKCICHPRFYLEHSHLVRPDRVDGECSLPVGPLF